MRLHHPPEERAAPPEGAAPALLVPAPELDVAADAADRAPPQPAELERERQVEPDDRVRLPEHELAELRLVVAVDHPPLGHVVHRLEHGCAELLGRRLVPVGPVVERVELDERQLEPPGWLLRERRLPGARGALDVDPPRHATIVRWRPFW